MPLCSGKVTVPSGCSTALVMNRRPGHAPQLPPPAVDALAGTAAAAAGMAKATSAARPSPISTNLILRNLVIFIGYPFSPAGPTTWPAANGRPAVSLTPIGVSCGPGLRPPAHTSERGGFAATRGLTNAQGGQRQAKALLSPR